MNENCIEVYLYKEFITPEHNIPLKESEYYRINKNSELKDIDEVYLNRLAFDTIKKKIVVKHGGFKNKLNLIESKPFINNNEIICFQNTAKPLSTAIISKKKILPKVINYKIWDNHLKQFVILVNKKPIINGYLYCVLSSSICENTNILIYTKDELILLNFKDRNLTNINLQKDYPELYQAFKNTNRLIE